MKFKGSSSFKDALSLVTGVVPTRTTFPIYKHVLIHAGEEERYVMAANGTMIVRADFEAHVDEPGACTVPADRFSSLVDMLDEFKISANKKLSLTGESTRALFQIMPSEEFVEMGQIVGASTVDLQGFQDAVYRALVAVHSEEGSPLSAVYATFDGQVALVGAADGLRASFSLVEAPDTPVDSFLIPQDAARFLLKLRGGRDLTLGRGSTGDRLIMRDADTVISTALQAGNFPDIRKVAPAEHSTTLWFGREAFRQALRRALVFAKENENVVLVDTGAGHIIGDIGAAGARVDLDIEVDGEPIKFAINGRFVLDALGVMVADRIRVDTLGPKAPMVFREPDFDETHRHVIMPMQFKVSGLDFDV
jgi:DNA polymerase-3 subunit beta